MPELVAAPRSPTPKAAGSTPAGCACYYGSMVSYGDTRLPEFFWSKVEPVESGCWLWQGYVTPNGYGGFSWGYKHGLYYGAHRTAYAVLVADPGELVVDHVCRVRRCVNPAHLDAVTQEENTRRGLLPYVNIERGWAQTQTGWETQSRCPGTRATRRLTRRPRPSS
jgi:hypothetical protein